MVKEIVLSWMIITGYCPCKKCCGEYSTKHHRVTASGKFAEPGWTAACAPDRMGQMLWIPQMKFVGQCEDRGSAITAKRIDIFFLTHQEALNFGRKRMKVYFWK